jgi:hypothetical protein
MAESATANLDAAAQALLDQDRPVRRSETLRLTVGDTDSHFFFRWLIF